MKTKSLLLLMPLFLTAFLVRGGNIDRETAKKVAVNFYYERYNITTPPDYSSI